MYALLKKITDYFCFGIYVLSFILCSDAHVLAAIQSTQASIPLTSTYNPKQAAADILLPMPHNLYLVLRAIAIPGGLVRDRRFNMGINHLDDGRQIYEASFESYIAASFEAKDLPEAWHKTLQIKNNSGFSYYFIGKYEVSQLQWDAVMHGLDTAGNETAWSVPKEVSEALSIPVRQVSWFEVQDFLKRYNQWLIKHAANNLPKYKGTSNIGFLRLPTEEEWEFAARGGILVKEEDRDNNDNFLTQDEKPEDYGVFVSENTPIRQSPLPIGQRKPNPLGLYDTMGNVREMISGFFRLTIEEIGDDNTQRRRRHGSSGGILCKGGSFRSQAHGVLPGWRDELPVYTSAGEYRAQDLGFRLVLVGLNIPNADRLKMMTKADASLEQKRQPQQEKSDKQNQSVQQKSSTERLLKIDRNSNVLAELDRITNATDSTVVRANLSQLRMMLADREQAIQRQQEDFIESTMRSTLYQAETIRAFALRYIQINDILQDIDQNHNVSEEQKQKALLMRTSYYHGLLTAANQYKSYLRRISQARPQIVQEIFEQFRQEYSGNATLDRHMLQNCTTLAKHVQTVRLKGFKDLSNDQICRNIIPARHLEKMPHFNKK